MIDLMFVSIVAKVNLRTSFLGSTIVSIVGFVQPYYLRRHMASHKETETEKASLDMMVESHTSSDEQTGIRTFACKFCRYKQSKFSSD